MPIRRSTVRTAPRPLHMVILLAAALCAMTGSRAGELQKRYDEHYKHPTTITRDVQRLEEVLNDHSGIDAIGLERTVCFGDCPVYTVIVSKDGRFLYDGEANVKRIGHFTGKVDTNELREIFRFVSSIGFSRLADGYSYPMTDAASTFTMVRKDGREKIVWNYANSGPPSLWAFDQLIDKLLDDAHWDAPKPDS